jgi:hypothetical protein
MATLPMNIGSCFCADGLVACTLALLDMTKARPSSNIQERAIMFELLTQGQFFLNRYGPPLHIFLPGM